MLCCTFTSIIGVLSTDGNLNTSNHFCILSLSVFLDSSDSIISLLNTAMLSVIFLLTSAFVLPEKLLRFLYPFSSIYQTTPHHLPSVHLKALPLVKSFFCISSLLVQNFECVNTVSCCHCNNVVADSVFTVSCMHVISHQVIT